MPDNEYPEYGQCVHKVARGRATASCSRRTTRASTARGDDGATWESIADGLPTDFGFTILAHPRRPGVVWNVPVQDDGERIPPGAQLQVQRSDDSGAAGAAGGGLPDHSYTCVLRDAAGLDAADPVGVYFGTRNGDVFASADEGETFQRIATQLPDVLVVRAAQMPEPKDPMPTSPVRVILPGMLRDLVGGVAEIEVAASDVARPSASCSTARSPSTGSSTARFGTSGAEIRPHVKVFVNGEDATRGEGVATVVPAGARVHIINAVSGG